MKNNCIVEGKFKNYRFIKHYGKIYLKCLESSFSLNQMLVSSLQVLDCSEKNSLSSILVRGFVLSKLLGTSGLLAGGLTANTKTIYRLKITFRDGNSALAVVDNKIYDALLIELFDI